MVTPPLTYNIFWANWCLHSVVHGEIVRGEPALSVASQRLVEGGFGGQHMCGSVAGGRFCWGRAEWKFVFSGHAGSCKRDFRVQHQGSGFPQSRNQALILLI